MAQITAIRMVNRPIRVAQKTTIDLAKDENWFSIWVHAAGQEQGMAACPVSLQLDKQMAETLMEQLGNFLHGE